MWAKPPLRRCRAWEGPLDQLLLTGYAPAPLSLGKPRPRPWPHMWTPGLPRTEPWGKAVSCGSPPCTRGPEQESRNAQSSSAGHNMHTGLQDRHCFLH